MVNKADTLYYTKGEVDRSGDVPIVSFKLYSLNYLIFTGDQIRETKHKILKTESDPEFDKWNGSSLYCVKEIKKIISNHDKMNNRKSIINKILRKSH